jgi:hypothetical protein
MDEESDVHWFNLIHSLTNGRSDSTERIGTPWSNHGRSSRILRGTCSSISLPQLSVAPAALSERRRRLRRRATQPSAISKLKRAKRWRGHGEPGEGLHTEDVGSMLRRRRSSREKRLYNVWAGIFGLVSEREKIKRYKGWHSAEAVKQKSFGMFAEKGTDLKMKRPFRPR